MNDTKRLWTFWMAVLVAVAVFSAGILTGLAQRGPAPSESEKAAAKASWPKDVNQDSGYRLPFPKREDFKDEETRKIFDEQMSGRGNLGLNGPYAVLMWSPQYAKMILPMNRFLRSEAAGLNAHVGELTILVGCRESASETQWTAHERLANMAGVDKKVIDAIRYNKSTDGLPEDDAAIIQLGRAIYRHWKVTPETFARANKIYGPSRLVNIVALMSLYSTGEAEMETFGLQMAAGEKTTWTPIDRPLK